MQKLQLFLNLADLTLHKILVLLSEFVSELELGSERRFNFEIFLAIMNTAADLQVCHLLFFFLLVVGMDSIMFATTL